MRTIYTRTLRAGEKWSGIIGRGKLIRFTALAAGANVSALIYNARNTAERYCMPDSLKTQHTAFFTAGHVLMSDNGRVLASVTADSTGWIDTISGYTDRAFTDAQYGKTTYQDNSNDYYKCGAENFAVELTRNGLSLRDLVPNLNLFSKVSCNEQGDMLYAADHCPADAFIALRTEMDILLILSNTPNPLDDRRKYPSVPVQFAVYKAAPVEATDICFNKCPENKRAFENTWDYFNLIEG
jgi:urea carboxylase-associated protein 2